MLVLTCLNVMSFNNEIEAKCLVNMRIFAGHLPSHLKRKSVRFNSLEDRVQVVPLSWGLVTSKQLQFRNKFDCVIGSDLFFDPDVFESLIVTVAS
jgi:hypothetical protein